MAVSSATHEDERASATKNIAIVHSWLAACMEDDEDKVRKISAAPLTWQILSITRPSVPVLVSPIKA